MVKKRAGEASMPLSLLFVPLLFCSSCCSAQWNITSDALALLDFKTSLTLGSDSTLASWTSSSISSICSSWDHVSCSSDPQRVSELHLESNKLSGGLPPGIANISALVNLNISFNNFSGSIPASLNNLTQLKSLDLQNNSFSGIIPFLNISSLETFIVSNNNLSGSIPCTLAKFPGSSFTGNANLSSLEACASAPSPQAPVPSPPAQSPPAPSPQSPPAPSPQAAQSKSNKLSLGVIVGIACGAAAAASLLLLLLLLCRKRKGGGAAGWMGLLKEETAETAWKEDEERNKLVFIDGKKLFELEDLLCASAEMLGKGPGSSYKSMLAGGLIVVTKRLHDVDDSRRDECRQHINSIGSLKHDNLVPLRAYYLGQGANLLLVYDFMQKGSLSALLHGNKGGRPDWEARMRIATTAARGVAVLHAHNMVHGNLKSTNVLLKSNLEACVADYGMLAFTPSAAHKPGGLGYSAPEITDPRQISPAADVFSFGVLLLELLTGKLPSLGAPPPSSGSPPDDPPLDLARWVQSVPRDEWTAQVFDPSLVQSAPTFHEEEMVQLLQVALACVTPSPSQRPFMVDVIRMIDNIRSSPLTQVV